jgi:hypothetical protein
MIRLARHKRYRGAANRFRSAGDPAPVPTGKSLLNSLVTGKFTGIFGKNGLPKRFSIEVFRVFSVGCASKSLLHGTGNFLELNRDFRAD